MTAATTGRLVASRTVQRALRRAVNGYAQQIAEKCLARALSGDGAALQAAVALLLAANGFEKPSPGNPAPGGVGSTRRG